jgi:putative (di)nucleoside polyphosphate hydrolase
MSTKDATPASQKLFRPNVAAILRNPKGEILICERAQNAGAWQFPQGGIDPGETPEQALKRELVEEISVPPTAYTIETFRGGYRYLFPEGKMKNGHHGKDQIYFLCAFSGNDSLIDVETDHPEFRAWRWVRPNEFDLAWLPEMKVEVYRQVFRDFFGIAL